MLLTDLVMLLDLLVLLVLLDLLVLLVLQLAVLQEAGPVSVQWPQSAHRRAKEAIESLTVSAVPDAGVDCWDGWLTWMCISSLKLGSEWVASSSS